MPEEQQNGADGRSLSELLRLSDLVEPSRWQRLQDHFARVLGIPIRTVDDSRQLLTNPSWPPSLDVERVIARLHVGEELERLIPQSESLREISSVTTSLGITYTVVPIRVTPSQPLAHFVVGPVVVGTREDEVQFRQRMNAAGLDAAALWPILLSLKLYTFTGIRSALHLMEEVGSTIVQLAYEAKQLGAILPVTSKVDQAVVAYYADRLLHSLLEAATMATRADGGSVMLYETQGGALRIRAAQGLSESVVAGTRVKRGEGIAGLAAGQREILMLDRQTSDERLRSRMQRPELSASLVAPLLADPAQEPVGVLNLRLASPERRFTSEHIELLRRLLDLTGAALGSLRFAFNQPKTSPIPS
jgi:hypothetical protein